jgi:capsular polysaccharide biosynthesis protein
MFIAYKQLGPTSAQIYNWPTLIPYLKFADIPFTNTNTINENDSIYYIGEKVYSKDITKDYCAHLLNRAQSYNLHNTSNKKIVIQRKHNRKIDDETLNQLTGVGFTVHYLENMSIEDQASLFNSASHIVAAHGSAISNILFCRPNTRIIEINTGFNPYCFQELAKHIYLKSKIYLDYIILIPDTLKEFLTKATDINEPFYQYNKRLIKTDNNTYCAIDNLEIFSNRENKNPNYIRNNKLFELI